MARRQRLQDGEQIPVHRPSSRGPTSWDTVVPAGPFITFFGKIISGGKRIVNLLRIKDNALEIDVVLEVVGKLFTERMGFQGC